MNIKKKFKQFIAHLLSTDNEFTNRFAVLNYHSVGGVSAGSLDPVIFSEHLNLINSNKKYCGISLNDKEPHSKEKIRILLTFDDGYLDNFQFAAPILEKHSLRGVFFITTGFIEGSVNITKNFKSYQGLEPMSWDHVRRLHEAGHVIGLHGHTHRAFSKMSSSEALDEMKVSLSLLKQRTGITAIAFAYPFGQLEHRRQDMVMLASQLGVKFIFSTENTGINRCNSLESASFRPIPRLRIDAGDDTSVLEKKIDGHWDYIANIQRIRSCLKLKSIKAYRAQY